MKFIHVCTVLLFSTVTFIRAQAPAAVVTSSVTPQGDEGWDNEIFELQGDQLKPMVQVRYEIASQR